MHSRSFDRPSSTLLVGLLALGLAGCGAEARAPEGSAGAAGSAETSGSAGSAGSTEAAGPAGWENLPPAPLSGRVEAVVASVGDTIIVTGGGANPPCPRYADCNQEDPPAYADGAAYDLGTGRWRRIADAPVGLRGLVSAVLGSDLYVLSQCQPHPTCPAGSTLFRYRSEQDTWDQLPALDAPSLSGRGLVAVSGGLLAFDLGDEGNPIYHFVAAEERWVALPDGPLGGGQVVEYSGRFFVFGASAEAEIRTTLAAAYDPAAGTWTELAPSGTIGFQIWRAGPRLYLNPHFNVAGGGIYDPATNEWSPLPDPPHHDLAGVIGPDEAAYSNGSGWVLDTRTGTWLQIEERPNPLDTREQSIAVGPAQSLVVFGGQGWLGEEPQHDSGLWLWRPPPAH